MTTLATLIERTKAIQQDLVMVLQLHTSLNEPWKRTVDERMSDLSFENIFSATKITDQMHKRQKITRQAAWIEYLTTEAPKHGLIPVT